MNKMNQTEHIQRGQEQIFQILNAKKTNDANPLISYVVFWVGIPLPYIIPSGKKDI
jgi:hypothetical protein